MKIRDYKRSRRYSDDPKQFEIDMKRLMSGTTFGAVILNAILKHLGFDDEEVICDTPYCIDCPFDSARSGIHCDIASSDYVRNLIIRKRDPLEDML